MENTNELMDQFGLKDISDRTPKDFVQVNIDINPKDLLLDFADAFSEELFRLQPRLVDKMQLSSKELSSYFKGVLYLRVLDVNGKNKFHRQERLLLVPAWIEYAISQIGIVTDSMYGLTFIPEMELEDFSIDDMIETSHKLSYYKDAGVELLENVYPRTNEGSESFMTMAVIKSKVCSYKKDADPLSVYLSAFLSSTLEERSALESLYRIEYQDVDYVRQVLRTTKGLLK